MNVLFERKKKHFFIFIINFLSNLNYLKKINIKFARLNFNLRSI